MMRFTLIVCIILLGASCSEVESKYPHVVIETQAGDIEVELYNDKAVKSVAAFLRNVDAGIYHNATFYRTLNKENQPTDAYKATLIQGGIYRTKQKDRTPLPKIPHETTKQTGILHKEGVVSFARLEPGSESTEFFICIDDQPGFDFGGMNNPDGQGYAAFGKVVKGMDVVKNIYNRPEDGQVFEPPIFIYNIRRK